MLAAINLLAPSLLCADDATQEETTLTYTAGEYVVIASRFEELKANVANSVTVITSDEIEQSPAQDLGELLAEKSLGHVQKYSGLNTTVAIRGFSSDSHGNDLRGQVLVLLDGRRVATGNLAKLLTSNVERIEVIKGPGAVQYGSAAIGGVVNVITKQGKGKTSFFVGQEMGSNEFTQTETGISGKSGSIDYSASYSMADRGDYETGAGDTYENTAYDDDIRANFNIGYEFAPDQRLGVIYNYMAVDRVGSSGYFYANDLDDYKESLNRSLDVNYNGRNSSGSLVWMMRYFTGKDKDLTMDPAASNPDPGRDNGSAFEKITDQDGIQGLVSLQQKQWSISSGVDWLDYELAQNEYSPLFAEYENIGYFLLAKGRLLDNRLILTGGLRYDDYKLTSRKDEFTSESSQDTDSVAKSLGVVYRLSDNIRFRSSYGEGYRVPDARELAADYTVGSKTYTGNPDLESEESRTYDLGVELHYNTFSSSLSFFSTRYRNYIEDVGSTSVTWENRDKATVNGFEGELSYMFPVTMLGWQLMMEPYVAGTVMTEYEKQYDDGSADQKLEDVPEWSMSTGLKMNDEHGFFARLNLACYGEEVTDFEGDEPVMKGAFYVANLSAAKKFTIGDVNKRGITIKGAVENLFDRDYEYVVGYPMPGRSFRLGFRVDI